MRYSALKTPDVTADIVVMLSALKATHWNYSLGQHILWFAANVGPEDSHVLALDGPEIAAYARVVIRPGRVDDKPATIAGISTVIVDEDRRNQGIGRTLLLRCLDEFPPGSVGVLQCSSKLYPWYASVGWRRFTGVISCEGPFLRDDTAMVYGDVSEKISIEGGSF